jgi:GNAT superfamily N-acetyltransferase
MSGVLTREVRPEDWRLWRDLRLRSLREVPDAFVSTHDDEVVLDEEAWRARLDGTRGPAVVAYVGGRPVGMGGGWIYERGRLEVVAMWTDPDWRGHGVGPKVLDHVVGWALDRDLQPDLRVADSNPSARRVYERYGFCAEGERAPAREGSDITMTRLVLAAESYEEPKSA